MELLHTINLVKANIAFENVELGDTKKRNSYVLKTPTTTLPFLETEQGNISESKAIQYYLCQKYKPELLGEKPFERATVNQWVEFACCEIYYCLQNIIYPIFGWEPFCKEKADKENEREESTKKSTRKTRKQSFD